MGSLEKYRSTVYVSSYSTKSKVMEGTAPSQIWTGEWKVGRSTPVVVKPTITPAKGNVYEQEFGTDVAYDRVATFDSQMPSITEDSVFWVDSVPQFDASGNLVTDAYGNPSVPFDYTVSRVSRSLHYTVVALKRVEVA